MMLPTALAFAVAASVAALNTKAKVPPPSHVYVEEVAITPIADKSNRACLALAMFTEARSEGVAGMAAVSEVVINRWHSNTWPSTVCSVVRQDSQFLGVEGWTAAKAERRNQEAWEEALAIADLALAGAKLTPKECRGAVFFNQSSRAKGMTHLCRVGAHHFYN